MHNKKFLKFAFLLILLSPLASCSNQGKTTVLRLLNMEDYIYVKDEDSGYYEEDLVDQFVDYIKDKNKNWYEEYGNIKVVYDTTDTNESLYSEMQTGKSLYDLMCPSDYMIQKLMSNDMLEKLDKGLIPNYFDLTNGYASEYVKGIMDKIEAFNFKTNSVEKVGDYSVGYMWGTLGILFNPEYYKYINEGLKANPNLDKATVKENIRSEIISDMQSWDTLWDGKVQENGFSYKGTISIKDSMRDTFAVGTMKAYEEDFQGFDVLENGDKTPKQLDGLKTLKEKFNAGVLNSEQYNDQLSKIFNYIIESEKDGITSVEVVNRIIQELNTLKANSFGLECDSGKQDIVTGKIGVNLAWSGDAVYSMDQGDDEEQVKETKELCYAIPETGSNIWFDGWVMPKLSEKQRSTKQRKLAHEFLNFLCDPIYAAKNMDYTGYTSFIGGNDILDLVQSWYDVRYSATKFYDEDEDSYYDCFVIKNFELISDKNDIEESDNFIPVTIFDAQECVEGKLSHKPELDEYPLYYWVDDNEDEKIDGSELHLYKYEVEDSGEDNTSFETMYYGDIDIDEETDEIELVPFDYDNNCYEGEVDLTYFFNNTLVDIDPSEMVFIDPDYFIGDDDNISVGRQFFCQYPDENTILRCAVMRDYGLKNEYVMKMWEEFKSNALPTWAIVLFVLEGVGLISFVAIHFTVKTLRLRLRKKRKLNNK